jgi:DNA-binding NarL/FixJ family response regulator
MQSVSVLGFLELSLGNFEAADAHLAILPVLLAGAGYREPGVCPCLPNAVEAALGVRDLDRARLLTNELEQQARAARNALALAAASRCRGLVLAAAGDIDAAIVTLNISVQEHTALTMPFELGRALLALGVVERRASHKRAARNSLSAALALFEELGAPLWAHKAQSELSRIGGRTAPRSGELTETERLIADLVAIGRTNDEVATELSLSTRTVQWNLTKIYRKLGVRSRTELAASLSVGDAT